MFSGFYSSTNDEIKASWSSDKTLFVFDTNVLLNLYAYTKVTREDFFKILDKISDNIWLPNHVGLEYQRNRLSIVKNEKRIFNDIKKYIENIEKSLKDHQFQNLKLKQRLPSLFEEAEELQSKISKLLIAYQESVKTWNDKQPDVRSSDKIRRRIDELFDEKIGDSFKEQKMLDDIYKEGKYRYENSIPPGYEDKKEKEKNKQFSYAGLNYIPMYGDLILWKQIIEKVKNDENIDSIVFITDDVKEDWWYILDSNGKKEIGVRAELRNEIYRESNINSFELLTTSDFMKSGKEFLKLEVEEKSINEAKENVVENKSRRVEKDFFEKRYKSPFYNTEEEERMIDKYIAEKHREEKEEEEMIDRYITEKHRNKILKKYGQLDDVYLNDDEDGVVDGKVYLSDGVWIDKEDAWW